jgi:hypothetical protein
MVGRSRSKSKSRRMIVMMRIVKEEVHSSIDFDTR